MLNLSWATTYGLYALHYLARESKPTTTAQIASWGKISRVSLSKSLQRLRQAGLVRSEHGGYWLARPPGTITVLEVVRVFEGPIPPTDLCLMKNRECIFQGSCPLSRLCHEIHVGIVAALGSLTIASLPVGNKGRPVCLSGRNHATP